MWWLRRIETVHVPNFLARSTAVSIAFNVNQGPGKRMPSQVNAAGKSAMILALASLRVRQFDRFDLIEFDTELRETVGKVFGVKASGGIRDHATMMAMIEAGANRIGASAGARLLSADASSLDGGY